MIEIIDVENEQPLTNYATDVLLTEPLQRLQEAVADEVASLGSRTVWMVSSTRSGGGVAETVPTLVRFFRELGVDTEWVVIELDGSEFFQFTKSIHNLLHDTGHPEVLEREEATYSQVSHSLAEQLTELLESKDILVVHDPQPIAAGAIADREVDITTIWRCHIGSETQSRESQVAWEFLRPWGEEYDHAIFSVSSYVPTFLRDKASIIPPAIDPFRPKNRYLKPQQVATTLARASLTKPSLPVETFDRPALRLQPTGGYASATEPDDIDVLFRPTICQISRWDRLKGFVPLLRGFERLKREVSGDSESGSIAVPELDRDPVSDETYRRRVNDALLVLAGPDPATVADDPGGQAVLKELEAVWEPLDPAIRDDVAVVVMPPDQNDSALVINALQRSAAIVVQNSVREGFGLTVTEAMWKRAVMVGSDRGGISTQIRDGENGRTISTPDDPESVARTLKDTLATPDAWDRWSANAQESVADEYLIFEHVRQWMDLLSELVDDQ